MTLAPLAFVVDIAAKLAVKAGGRTLLSISLALTLSGPRPWRARGRASFSILFFDVSFGVRRHDRRRRRRPRCRRRSTSRRCCWPRSPTPRAWTRAAARRRRTSSRCARSNPGRRCSRTRSRRSRCASASPRWSARSTASARASPAARSASGSRSRRSAASAPRSTPLQDRFAPAQFTALSDDAKLSAPSFEEMTSGAALGADGYVDRHRPSPSASSTSSCWSPRAGVAEPKPAARRDPRRRLRHADRDAARAPAGLRRAGAA